MILDDRGLVIVFEPETTKETNFLKNDIYSEPWQWIGNGKKLAVEHRFGQYLALIVRTAGFHIKNI